MRKVTEIARTKKIAVIGNGGGGKTTLSRLLGVRYAVEVTHVDSIQYLSGLRIRDRSETSKILNEVANRPSWLIDGFGSFEDMTKRFELADRILFIDFPLWRHYWWCTKRQIRSLARPRVELPSGCNEATLVHTIELFRILWRVHFQIKPKLLSIFGRREISEKVVRVSSLKEWNEIRDHGLPTAPAQP